MAMFGGKSASVSAAKETPASWVTRGLAKGYGMFGMTEQEAWRRAQQLSTALQTVTPLGVADVAWQDTQNLMAGRQRDPLGVALSVIPGAPKGARIPIFRGISKVSPKSGHYYTPDKDWALQFTQSGREAEVMRRFIDPESVYRAERLPRAFREDEMDAALAEARANKRRAIWVDEGDGEPNSVFIIDHAALRQLP